MQTEVPEARCGGGKDRAETQRQWSRAAGLGIDLLAGMLLFIMGGYWLDQRRGTGVFWTLCGMFLGLIYGAYEVWKTIRGIDTGAQGKAKPAGPPGEEGRE
jgi:F0F1-type ATP synthase assembly protein I